MSTLPRSVPSFVADKYDLDRVLVAVVDSATSMSGEVRSRVPVGGELYIHKDLDPAPGEIVMMRRNGRSHLGIYRDGDAQHDVLGVCVGLSIPSPQRF